MNGLFSGVSPDAAYDFSQLSAAEIDEYLTAKTSEDLKRSPLLTDGEMAARAVSTFLVPVGTLPFEKCSALLCKAFRYRSTTKLLLGVSYPLVKLGYFFLKCFVLLSDCKHSVDFGYTFDEFRRRSYSVAERLGSAGGGS